MVVAVLTVELFLPGSRSLKDKRMVLRRLKDRVGRFNVAVAEIDHHDLWQRAALGLAAIATTDEHADRELAAALAEIERVEPGLVTRTDLQFLR